MKCSGAKIEGENTYTLVGTKDIAGKTYLVLQVKPPWMSRVWIFLSPLPQNTPAAKMTIAVKATGKTQTLFDEQAGEVGDSKVDMQMDMTDEYAHAEREREHANDDGHDDEGNGYTPIAFVGNFCEQDFGFAVVTC